jgi:hypothetical protein
LARHDLDQGSLLRQYFLGKRVTHHSLLCGFGRPYCTPTLPDWQAGLGAQGILA